MNRFTFFQSDYVIFFPIVFFALQFRFESRWDGAIKMDRTAIRAINERATLLFERVKEAMANLVRAKIEWEVRGGEGRHH